MHAEELAGSLKREERILPDGRSLAEANAHLEKAGAEERVAWAVKTFGGGLALTSSFGAQAAVSLHLAVSQWPEIPVVLVDTGYLFPETYQFIDDLAERMKLNLKVYRSELSPAWQEARHGKLWEQGLEGLEKYNRMNKVEPMKRAVRELGLKAWMAGLRREQSESRGNLRVVQVQDGVVKIHPILDWTNRDVHFYLKKHGLPYHPLWDQGYVSIGDTHTSRPMTADMTEEQTRFFGLKRECGLHEAQAWEI